MKPLHGFAHFIRTAKRPPLTSHLSQNESASPCFQGPGFSCYIDFAEILRIFDSPKNNTKHAKNCSELKAKGRHFNGNPKASNGRETGRSEYGSGSAATDKGRASVQKNAADDTTA